MTTSCLFACLTMLSICWSKFRFTVNKTSRTCFFCSGESFRLQLLFIMCLCDQNGGAIWILNSTFVTMPPKHQFKILKELLLFAWLCMFKHLRFDRYSKQFDWNVYSVDENPENIQNHNCNSDVAIHNLYWMKLDNSVE